MFLQMVFRAIGRQWKKMLMIAFTIALGTSLSTAMLNVMFDVGDKVNQELKTYGANIRVVPQNASLMNDLYGIEEKSYLNENELGNLKTIFWAFNIVDFSPYLQENVVLLDSEKNSRTDVKLLGTWFNHHLSLPTGEELDTGMINMKKWWEVKGEWISEEDSNCAMIGISLAGNNISIGDEIQIESNGNTKKYIIKGIFDSGSEEDNFIYVNLDSAQDFLKKDGLVSSIEVSALTTPDNDLARRAAQDPSSLNRVDWDTWYCTAYVSSICYQIQEVVTGSIAKAVRQVAESEGEILNKTQLLMTLITILSLIASALGISNLVTASVMERSKEIGLLKALGAYDAPISFLILTEIFITAIIGAILGYFVGLGFAQIIGHSVFASSIALKLSVIPLVIILITIVTLLGSVPSIRLLLSLKPAEVLHGGH